MNDKYISRVSHVTTSTHVDIETYINKRTNLLHQFFTIDVLVFDWLLFLPCWLVTCHLISIHVAASYWSKFQFIFTRCVSFYHTVTLIRLKKLISHTYNHTKRCLISYVMPLSVAKLGSRKLSCIFLFVSITIKNLFVLGFGAHLLEKPIIFLFYFSKIYFLPQE